MTRGQPRSRHGRRTVLVLVLLCATFAVATARLFVWPDLPPPPDHVDAIIELAGPGNRDAVTIALAREGRAPLVIQSTLERDTGSGTCLPHQPGVTIACFHPVPGTTRGEARYIGRLGARLHWHSIIIVTTPDHAWRARLRIMRCFSGEVYVRTSPLPGTDWFRQIPYQWAASAKALLVQRDC